MQTNEYLDGDDESGTRAATIFTGEPQVCLGRIPLVADIKRLGGLSKDWVVVKRLGCG